MEKLNKISNNYTINLRLITQIKLSDVIFQSNHIQSMVNATRGSNLRPNIIVNREKPQPQAVS